MYVWCNVLARMCVCAVSSGSSLHAYMKNQGSKLQLNSVEYPTLFSWTSPLPFWIKIFTDHVYCPCVKDYDNLLSSQSSNPFILIDCSILRKL